MELETNREKLLALDQVRTWMSCLDKTLVLVAVKSKIRMRLSEGGDGIGVREDESGTGQPGRPASSGVCVL